MLRAPGCPLAVNSKAPENEAFSSSLVNPWALPEAVPHRGDIPPLDPRAAMCGSIGYLDFSHCYDNGITSISYPTVKDLINTNPTRGETIQADFLRAVLPGTESSRLKFS